MNAAMKEVKSTAHQQDAIAMLTADHKKVKGLFDQFEKMKSQDDSDDEKTELVGQICQELTVHAQLEEEIFYPAVRKSIGDEDLMDEAEVEHACAKDLIAQLQEMDPQDDLYDAKVTVLGEQIQHHVKEEEGDMFIKVKKSKLDTKAMGGQMATRKEELTAEMGGPSDEDDDGEQSDDHAASAGKHSAKHSSAKR